MSATSSANAVSVDIAAMMFCLLSRRPNRAHGLRQIARHVTIQHLLGEKIAAICASQIARAAPRR